MAEVTLNSVYKVYPGNVTAVKDFELQIKDKEFMVLVGPSGCGKSTTLRMIAGLEEISQGTVKIGERVVNDVAPKNRDIAMVFQNYALYPHMTVYDNMAFGLKLRGTPKAEIKQRVTEAAEILGLGDLLERLPKALSGGQRQRVAVGRAIVRNPAVFLFDEPLSNLDAKMRVQMRCEIMHLRQRVQTTMIYVTHDQVEAMTLGDRIVVMKDGLIMQVAEPLVVYHYPANLFVARFIGTPPMNIFAGRLEKGENGFVFNGGSFKVPLPIVMNESIQNNVDKNVYFGIRPEDIELKERAEAPSVTITGQVDVAERLGNETLVHMITGEHAYQVRISSHSDPVLPGSGMELCPAIERAHIFDGDNGLNLTAPDHAFGTTHAADLTAEDLLKEIQVAGSAALYAS